MIRRLREWIVRQRRRRIGADRSAASLTRMANVEQLVRDERSLGELWTNSGLDYVTLNQRTFGRKPRGGGR